MRAPPSVFFAAAVALGATSCARDTGTIVIGLAGPLQDPLGVSEQRAARFVVDQINQHGGVRGGRQLRLRIVDDSSTENGAVLAAKALYDDPAVVAVVGHITSGTSIAVCMNVEARNRNI